MKKTKFIAVNALALALIFLFTFVTIPGLPLRLAVFVLLTVLAVSQCADFKSAVFVSVSMGLVSLLANWLAPVSPTSFMFRNPLISVLPRLFIGPVVYIVHKGLQKLLQKKLKPVLRDSISSFVSAICGVLTNTGLVILMIFICYFGKTVEGTMINGEYFLLLVGINFAIEISVNAVLAPPLVFAMRKVLGVKVLRNKINNDLDAKIVIEEQPELDTKIVSDEQLENEMTEQSSVSETSMTDMKTLNEVNAEDKND